MAIYARRTFLAGVVLLAASSVQAEPIEAAGVAVELPPPEGFAPVAADAPAFRAANETYPGMIVGMYAPAGFSGVATDMPGTYFFATDFPRTRGGITDERFAALKRSNLRDLTARSQEGGPPMPTTLYSDYRIDHIADDGHSATWIGHGYEPPATEAGGGTPWEVEGASYVRAGSTVLQLHLISRDMASSAGGIEEGWRLLRAWAAAIAAANPVDEPAE